MILIGIASVIVTVIAISIAIVIAIAIVIVLVKPHVTSRRPPRRSGSTRKWMAMQGLADSTRCRHELIDSLV